MPRSYGGGSLAKLSAHSAQILEEIGKMLDDPTCEIVVSRGVWHHPDENMQWMVAEPTKGREICIRVHGGAKEFTTY